MIMIFGKQNYIRLEKPRWRSESKQQLLINFVHDNTSMLERLNRTKHTITILP
jgi:hypothetical protein